MGCKRNKGLSIRVKLKKIYLFLKRSLTNKKAAEDNSLDGDT